MAEAEDVITDAVRHAASFAQRLWQRHRQGREPRHVTLADVQPRLDLLAVAVFGRSFRIRPAQPPAPRTWLDALLRRREAPVAAAALPATDGASIWLPRSFALAEPDDSAVGRYRIMLLQQAMRAMRGSCRHYPFADSAVVGVLYHMLEARAAEVELSRLLPGLQPAIATFRAQALAARPAMHDLPKPVQAFERMLRVVLHPAQQGIGLAGSDAAALAQCTLPASAADVLAQARACAAALPAPVRQAGGRLLVKDGWLGDMHPPPPDGGGSRVDPAAAGENDPGRPNRTGRQARRPQVRQPVAGEDEQSGPGPAMVQTAQPHEQAEDPLGMQRPTDRDRHTAADEFGDALSELPEARLVSSPEPAAEVLLSDDGLDSHLGAVPAAGGTQPGTYRYPEWHWQSASYLDPGATVLVQWAAEGAQGTVDAILGRHGGMLQEVRRRFEMLRSQPVRLRRQLDGEAIDLQAWIDSRALLLAGGSLDQRLYESERRGRRNMAVTLLVDISGSTDSWVGGQGRVIDVEREALLLVCVALDGLGEPFSVLGFSGEGRHGVVVRTIKAFEEPYDSRVALRIAGLEPEKYTRAGAALRHASVQLMAQPAQYRLLVMLSDGRPNDMDEYEGRYGVEDMRQAVTEARLQGIWPFCLTIDRQAAAYLPAVFGQHSYALLQRAELLPAVLLAWLRKLVAA